MGTIDFRPDPEPAPIRFTPDPEPEGDVSGDVFSEGGAQAHASGTEDINPVVGGAEALAHAATANTIGLAGPALGGARYWAGRLTGESPEEARQRGDAISAAIAPYTVYEPATKSGKAVTEAAGNAIMAPFEKAANVVEAPMSDAARQSFEEAAGDVNRTAAMLPLLAATPGSVGAVRGAAYDAAAHSAAIDAARDAATAPPAPPSATGGPDPAHYAPQPPKPRITPKAGESAQAAAARQGVQPAAPEAPPAQAAPAAAPAPSAAPDRAGNPAPSPRDPGFFPAPDNLGTKSGPVAPEQQAARQAAVERGAPTLPQVRDSAITNDYNDQGRDWTGRQAGDPAAVAQTATEAAALHHEAGRISAETGGQQGTGEAADRVRGQAYQDWHDSTVQALDKHISAAYAAEDTAAKQIASPGSNLKGVLTNDALIDSADASHVRNSVVALGKSMGVDLTDPNSTMNAYQIEQLRKHANSVYGNAPRFAQAVKNAADADLPSGAYVNARKLRQIKADMFENRDGINQLGQSKDIDPATGRPRPENRPVKAPDVMKKIEGMDPGQVQHIHNTMKRSASVLEALGDHETAVKIGDKAHKAAQQMQSHFTSRWVDEAEKGGGWNTRRANQFLRGNQETLNAVLSPEQMHQIRNVSEAANVLDLDKGYKGAFAQFRSGASWLRQRLGRTAEGMITDALPFGNTIGELTGASEHLRNVLGGANKSEAPKNFTRAIGPGRNQRGGPAMGGKNYPVIDHDYDPETGEHVVKSPFGQTTAEDHGNDIRVIRSDTREEGRRQGEGTARMAYLADQAHARGGQLIGGIRGDSISPGQEGVYRKLAERGYQVTKNPNAVRNPLTGNLMSDDFNRPVYTVGPKPAPEAPTKPLGQTLFGGKQRGGPKFERQAGAEKAGGTEEPAMVNVGLHQGTPGEPGFRQMSKQEVVAALKAQGVKVGKTSVHTPEGGEPTLVADVNRPLASNEMQNVLAKTKQSAIPQRLASGEGQMHVAPGHEQIAKEQGWDTFNPDYFREHSGATMTQERSILGNLTEQERAQIRNRASDKLVSAFENAPSEKEFAAAALAGQAKRGWYRHSAEAIVNAFGPADGPRFAATLAAMSPQTSVEMNFHNALRTYVNWDRAGRPTDPAAIRKIMTDSVQKQAGGVGVLPAWENNTIRALTADDPTKVQLSGPKVHSFYNNLIGNVHEVTNDAWQAAFAKIDPKQLGGSLNKSGPGKSATYLALNARVRAAAQTLTHLTGEKWTPAEVQETVWSWAKTAFEHAEELGDKTIPELVKHGGITDELIRSTPDFHQLFGSGEHRGFLAGSRFAGAAKRMAAGEGKSANAAGPVKASASAQETLRPHLLSAAERLESVRQARSAARTEEAPF